MLDRLLFALEFTSHENICWGKFWLFLSKMVKGFALSGKVRRTSAWFYLLTVVRAFTQVLEKSLEFADKSFITFLYQAKNLSVGSCRSSILRLQNNSLGFQLIGEILKCQSFQCIADIKQALWHKPQWQPCAACIYWIEPFKENMQITQWQETGRTSGDHLI